MFRSILSHVGATSRRYGIPSLLAMLTLIAAFAWTGCGEESTPPSGPGTSAGFSGATVDGYDALPPESQAKLDLVLSILDDITSQQQDRVDAAFLRLDELEPGLYDQVIAGLIWAFESVEGSDGRPVTIRMPLEIQTRADGDSSEGPTICTKITIEFTFTIHKGSKITYRKRLANGAIIRHSSVLHEDTTFTFNKVFEFECEGVEGCTLTHSSETEFGADEVPIKHDGPDTDGDGLPDFVVDIKISTNLNIKVETKTCE